MYMNLNARTSPDQIVARLTKEATLNIASHLLRLELVTQSFALPVGSYTGAERDYVIGVLYSMNENIALLRSLGSGELLDALLVNNINAKAWYDESIKAVHENIGREPALAEDAEQFSKRWELVRPSPKTPAGMAELDEAFAEDDLPEEAFAPTAESS